MTKTDAIQIRDKYRKNLIGKPLDNSSKKYEIRDVIVSDLKNLVHIYTKMWDNNITNENVLSLYTIEEKDYNVYVISHQWNWGSGDLLYEEIQSYLKASHLV